MAEDELLAILANSAPPVLTEYIRNGEPPITDTIWIKGILWAIAAGEMTHNGAFASEISQDMAGTLAMGSDYVLTVENTGFAGTIVRVTVGGAQEIGTLDAGTYVQPFTASGNYSAISIANDGPGAIAISRVSIQPA